MMNVEEKIIERATSICKTSFMHYPDFDENEPLGLADALTIILMEDNDEFPPELQIEGSAELYDYLNEKLQ